MKNKEFSETISSNYDKYLRFANNMRNGKDDPQDVLQETMMELLDMPAQKQEKIMPYLDYYVIQMLKYSFRSTTSKYYRKYRMLQLESGEFSANREYEQSNFEEFDAAQSRDITFALAEQTLSEAGVSHFDKGVLMQYVSDPKLSWRAFATKTGISDSSLFAAFCRARDVLREKLACEQDPRLA